MRSCLVKKSSSALTAHRILLVDLEEEDAADQSCC